MKRQAFSSLFLNHIAFYALFPEARAG